VFHHLSLNPGSALAAIPLLGQGWLFVDLFFVLSGFVIASVHAECEATGLAARRFLTRRLFRLYPLHLATLGAALAIDLHKGVAELPGYGAMVVMNLAMVHSWGLVPGSVLNGPSWSISTEWAAYLLFAGICVAVPGPRDRIRLLAAIGLGSLAILIIWRGSNLDGDLTLRLPRCLVSFALGALVWSWSRAGPILTQRRAWAVQLGAAAAMLLLLAAADKWPSVTLLMPVLSGAIILAMVNDQGTPVRRALERPLPQFLGRCSYSIYLLHMPLFGLLILATPGGWPARAAAANLWIAGAVGLLLALSALTYKWIERPGRDFGRRLADRHEHVKLGPASQTRRPVFADEVRSN
jgi:peptidoglycan/LPS O-acetylase OafA/YrhL